MPTPTSKTVSTPRYRSTSCPRTVCRRRFTACIRLHRGRSYPDRVYCHAAHHESAAGEIALNIAYACRARKGERLWRVQAVADPAHRLDELPAGVSKLATKI